jgi:hypothetical protein
MSSFFDLNQANQVKGLTQQYPTTSMEGIQTGPASVKREVWSDPQWEENTPKWSLDLIHPPTQQKEPQHTFFASSSDEDDMEDKSAMPGTCGILDDLLEDEDYGKKTTIFNKKVVAESNLSDQSTDSEVEEITNQPELQEGFGRWDDRPWGDRTESVFSEESLPEDLTHLKPPKKCVRQIGEGKYQLPLKMLKHFKLNYIHVATKWNWDMTNTYKGTVKGAWVYAIFKLQDDVEEKLKPKKVIIYVPEYYAKRAYDVGRKSFDDDSEFQQFLKSPQWWKEISDFDCRDV